MPEDYRSKTYDPHSDQERGKKVHSGRPPTGGPLTSGAPPRKSRTAGRPPTLARRAHLIDRAVEWARRMDRGESQTDIRKSIPARSRPSRGYISIVARLGHALKDLPPLEFELYRSPRVTLRLAQEIVRTDATTLAIRQRLRQAITTLPHPADRKRGRRARSGTRAGAPGGVPGDASGFHTRRTTDPDVFAWQWDVARAEHDPTGYVEEYVAFLERLHREMTRRTRAAVARRAAPPIAIAGQSLASLAASVAAYRRTQLGTDGQLFPRPPVSGTPAAKDQKALEALAALGGAIDRVRALGDRTGES